MPEIDRNTLSGFSRRTWKNYYFIERSHIEFGTDVHIVTQLVISLLALIIFPYEHKKRTQGLAQFQLPLTALEQAGWPHWNITLGSSPTLDGLIRHLRNACSHRRIRFSSDSRLPDGVDIQFWDRPRPNEPDNWGALINGAELRNFLERLAELVET